MDIVKVEYFFQPRYYNKFHCIGGSCPVSCCIGWEILWKKDEIEKLKNSECSEELRSLIDTSFEPYTKDESKKDTFIIKFKEGNRCPFLTEDNFCMIQRELGEDYLSHTCSTYPRVADLYGNKAIRFCNLSCCHLMNTICSDEDCMKLEKYRPKIPRKMHTRFYESRDIAQHPELAYHFELFEFFYEVLSDTSRSIEASIVLCVLAAQSISKLIEKKEYQKITKSLLSLKTQLNNPEQIKSIENIKPNYSVKLGFLSELDRNVFKSNIVDFVSENGILSADKYNLGMARFNEAFADRPFALRNIALNLFMECKMPFRSTETGIFESLCYYAAAFAGIKYIAAALFSHAQDSEDDFKKIISYLIGRNFAHNSRGIGVVMDIYKKHNCMSPAYIALILK